MTQIPTAFSANIIVSSGKVWRWQLDLILSLTSLELIKVNDVISNDDTTLSLGRSIRLLHQCDAAIFRSPLSAFELADASLLLCEKGIVSDGSAKVDILINLSEANVSSKYYDDYGLGVLETHFSVDGNLNSQQLAISEYLNKQSQVCISVAHVDSKGNSKTLSESRPSLDKGSLTRNLNQYFQLINSVWLRSFSKVKKEYDVAANPNAIELGETGAYGKKQTFSKAAIPKLCQRFGENVADKLLQKYKRNEQWILLLQFRGEHHADDMPLSFDKYVELIPPEDVFWADPFIISEGGKHFVFFEELPFETEQGHLSCMEVFEDGSYSIPKVILKQSFHLSFPNVFKYESTYYMIPESGDNGSIDLYRCTEFPYQWERVNMLVEGLHAYDSTLFEQGGQWWLFATVAAEKGMSGNEELHIFYADSPISNNWRAHNANPVISDASTARPAGQFFKVGEDWFRPSQDCAGHYGAGLNINKVIQLDENQYIEQQVSCSRPDWKDNLIALHTLNFNNEVAVADALRVTPKGIF